MKILELDGVKITVEKKNVKNLNLTVKQGEVFLSVPYRVTLDEAERFVREKLPWIKKHLSSSEIKEKSSYLSGDTVYVFGKPYILEIFASSKYKPAVLGAETLFLYVKENSSREEREKLLMKFYAEILSSEIPAVVEYWEDIMNVKSSGIRYRAMTSRWGSCNVITGEICFNTHLAKKPRECTEYVVVHELAHLIERSHNSIFKAIMSQFLPDWKERKNLLNKGGL